MYNRYVPGEDGYVRIPEDDMPPREAQRPPERQPPEQPLRQQEKRRGDPFPGQELLRQLTEPLRLFTGENRNAGAAGILKTLGLEDLDSGDILLLLILLFLILEGDDWEPVIALGLLLLFGLSDGKKKAQNE